ncbi:hypothetical protein R3P38DRAFT_2508461 [Favolaschia claudopus]|uniref:Uncharacterized protein n=1 Tax=Favolaschia claudopus TaxID=2862362 RepID=A0AAW0D5X0_9AGAR
MAFKVLVSASHPHHTSYISLRRADAPSSNGSRSFIFDIPRNSRDDSFSDWMTAVCLHPESVTDLTDCNMPGFFRCPNPDVSGYLVRIPAYLVNLCLGIIFIYHPKQARDGVWTQLLTVYALLISALVAIWSKGLTRFHSQMTVFLVLSPLSLTLLVYAILGFCGRSHNLDCVLSSDRKHLIPRILVVWFWITAIFLLIFTSIANEHYFLPPLPCDRLEDKGHKAAIVYNLICVPYVGVVLVIVATFFLYGSVSNNIATNIVLGTITPLLILIISVLWAAIISRRWLSREVAKLNVSSRLERFWGYWELFAQRYPFLHFSGVFLFYWVTFNELRIAGTADNIFSPSFGQVLATFVVLEPLWQVLKMSPRVVQWVRKLLITRWMTGRRAEDWEEETNSAMPQRDPDQEEMVSFGNWNNRSWSNK